MTKLTILACKQNKKKKNVKKVMESHTKVFLMECTEKNPKNEKMNINHKCSSVIIFPK